MTVKKAVFSWDSILSIILTIVALLLLPHQIGNDFVRDLYAIGISVLSIVFSLYFAALAIIVSSGDDLFIKFLEKRGGYYTVLLGTFKYSLIVIFIALIYSLVLYGVTSYLIKTEHVYQNKWFAVGFVFLFSYGLFVALFSILDSISYAKYRSKFLTSNHTRTPNENENS